MRGGGHGEWLVAARRSSGRKRGEGVRVGRKRWVGVGVGGGRREEGV